MFLIVGVKTTPGVDARGYFYCPSCRARKPCNQCALARHFTLFFVPLIPLGTLGEYYECQGCWREFDADSNFPFDFGDHENPKLWTCSRCHATNPSHAHQCQVCGFS